MVNELSPGNIFKKVILDYSYNPNIIVQMNGLYSVLVIELFDVKSVYAI